MKNKSPKKIIKQEEKIFGLLDFKLQSILLCVLGFVLYMNTFQHEYAFDDGLVIIENKWVQQGFRGINDIMTHGELDAFYEKYGSKEQFSGGRYRPLSIVTFAIENEFFGDNPHVRHTVNVLLYMFTLYIMLVLFRKYIFPDNHTIAFVSVLLFTIHPIHSEAIANIKNRSEILALLFALLSMYYAFIYAERKKIKYGIIGALFLMLAMLSKEYGVVMFILIPLGYYIIRKTNIKNAIIYSIPFWTVIFLYLMLRIGITKPTVTNNASTEVLNNQYIIADASEKIATKIYVLILYLKSMIIPYPQSCDYSFNQIPFIKPDNFKFLISAIIHLALITGAIRLIIKRHIIGFIAAFYLGHLFLISNLLIEIGTTFSERLAYLPSMAFCMILGWGIYFLTSKLNVSQKIKTALPLFILVIFTGISSYIIINRNKVWKNDITLFNHDVKNSPNSVLVLGNVGKNYLVMAEDSANFLVRDSLLLESIKYSGKAVKIHPKFLNGYINLSLAQMMIKDFDGAETSLKKASEIFPSHPKVRASSEYLSSLLLDEGIRYGVQEKKYDLAILFMERALKWNPSNAEIYYNMGGLSFTIGNYSKAKYYWDKTLKLNPQHEQAKLGLGALPVSN